MPCLTPELRTLYLENRLERDERERVEAHLSACSRCRRVLVAGYEATLPEPASVVVPSDLLRRGRSVGRRVAGRAVLRVWLAAAAAVAAGLGLVVLQLPRTPDRHEVPDPEALRTVASGDHQIAALAPTDGEIVSASALELRWTELPAARDYTLTVTDGLGDVVFQETTSDGRFQLDLEALDPPLPRGIPLYWHVSADLVDGTSQPSQIRHFTWSPSDSPAASEPGW